MSKAKPSDGSSKQPRRAVRIGKYEVVRHIATGGMGAVYQACDTELGREVALKVLPPEMAAKPAMVERFRREARHAARLRHENIVTIYEFGEVSGTHYLALEYVEGTDLSDYISLKGRLDPEEARLITIQATHALAHAHQQGIVHRDIKPSNFLVTNPHGGLLVKMTDLGLSRVTGDEDFRVTRAGTTVGTVDYMAPEQARDSGAADIRSDLYSLGCTLYHMLTGQPPFPDGSLTERLYKHCEDEPVNICETNPAVPRTLWFVIKKLLSKKPQDRYATPEDLLHDLLHLDEVPVDSIPVGYRPMELLAGLAQGEIERPSKKVRARIRSHDEGDSEEKPIWRSPRTAEKEDTEETVAAATQLFAIRRATWPWVVLCLIGALLLSGGVVFLLVWLGGR